MGASGGQQQGLVAQQPGMPSVNPAQQIMYPEQVSTPQQSLLSRLFPQGLQNPMRPGGALGIPEGVTGPARMMANPMLQMGLGLLSGQRQGKPFQGAMQGLLGASQAGQQHTVQQRAQAEYDYKLSQRKRMEELGKTVQGILSDPNETNTMPEWLSQSAAELATVDPAKALDLMSRYKATQEGQIGKYNPRDYTAQSWANWLKTGATSEARDATVLKRWNPFDIIKIGGVNTLVNTDPDAPQPIVATLGTLKQEAAAKEAMNFAAAIGTARGADIIASTIEGGKMDVLDQQIQMIFASPHFEGAVGPIDRVFGSIGQWMGTDEGVLGGTIDRLAKGLTTSKVADWKGAISNVELAFFQASVPQRGSSSETWRQWYQNEFLPFKEFTDARAAGKLGGVSWFQIKQGGRAPGSPAATGTIERIPGATQGNSLGF